MLKKIIPLFITVILLSSTVCIAARAVSADAVLLDVQYTSAFYTQDGVVSEKYISDPVSYDSSAPMGSDVIIDYDYASADVNATFVLLKFTFPSKDLLIGQSYRLSFASNWKSTRQYTYGYFYNASPIVVSAAGSLTIEDCKNVGDSSVYPSVFHNFFDSKLKTAGSYVNLAPFNGRVTVDTPFTVDINIPSDYGDYSTDGKNPYTTMYYYLLIVNNAYDNEFILQDLTLTPIGDTVYLYSDKEFQEDVKEDLSDIKDGLNEIASMPELEGELAADSGNTAIDSILDGIENKGTGFFNAMSGLMNAMSYTGTDCNWKFPAMYIPAISGVIDRTQLNDELDIDLTYWIDKIPSSVMSVIQAVLTIALILYCFRELYNVLSYVFTLKER